MNKKEERIKITTPEFRVSFPTVFEAKAMNAGDKPKYSIQMLFRVAPNPKDPDGKVVDITPLKEAVKAILVQKLGAGWEAECRKTRADGSRIIRLPFRNGKEKDLDGFDEGIVFCSASSVNKPGLVDAALQPIISPSEFYGGCYARATLNPYWYDTKGNKGVALGLQNIQKLRDGVPFSGKVKAEDDFDAIAEPATGATPVGAGSGDNVL